MISPTSLGLFDGPSPWDGVDPCRAYLHEIEAASPADPMRASLLEYARQLLAEAEALERQKERADERRPAGTSPRPAA